MNNICLPSIKTIITIMAPLRVSNMSTMDTIIEQNRVSISPVQYGDSENNKYPFYWWSLRDNTTDAFHSGLQLVLRNVYLPIVFNNNSGSLLVKLGHESRELLGALQLIEHAIRDALPDHMKASLQPIKRVPAMGEPSLSLKCRYAAIDAQRSTTSDLTVRNVISSAVISMQKLTSYNNKLYVSMQLHACVVDQPSAELFPMQYAQHRRMTDEDMFELMADEPIPTY
jgi:hypothetical protein